MHSGNPSCESLSATMIEDLAKILDNQGRVDTFILDFEKVFDTPPYELLQNQNQNSLLVKRQIDNIKPWGMGLDRRGLVPDVNLDTHSSDISAEERGEREVIPISNSLGEEIM